MSSATDILSEWQRTRLNSVHSEKIDYGTGRKDVTVLTYYWGASPENAEARFFRVESAFRETWLHCGCMKSVIVTDKITSEVSQFAEKFPNVEVQIEPKLIPGNLDSMSFDCDSRLAERFETPYLMIIQDDGFPLQSGIDKFLGKWDFIGAPYVRDRFFTRIIASFFNLWTSNGGFSIRTHRMCEMAAYYWRKKYCNFKGDVHWLGEDAYYTETLLKYEWKYNQTMKMADNRSALKFAYDIIVPQPIKELPFGFHRAETFVDFLKRGWVK